MCDYSYSDRKGRELRERSSSARNIKTHKQVKNDQYFGNTARLEHPQLTSKQSKEYSKPVLSEHKGSNKNGQNTEYIKSLYKKYLGKQNQNKSERKQKMEAGVVRNLFGKQNKHQQSTARPVTESIVMIGSLTTQGSQGKYQEEDALQYYNYKYSLAKSKQLPSVDLPTSMRKQPSKESVSESMYFRMLNERVLECMGESRSSMVCCMRNIMKAKKLAHSTR